MGKSSRKKKKDTTKTVVSEQGKESLHTYYNQQLSQKNIRKSQSLKYYLAVSVSLITFLVYLKSLQNEFINWDDDHYVYENSFIRSLNTQLLKSAFTEFHSANWHPLTWFSHAFDYALWGLNPLGHHLTNNILHALNTSLVALLVMMLMEAFKKTAGKNVLLQQFLNDRTIMITGAVTGLLFGLHPLHVESVAWVAERKDLLCALFFLLSITTYTHYVREFSATAPIDSASRFFNKTYLFALGFFVLSLLSKPMAVTLPFVLLILDWYLFRRIQSLQTFLGAFIEKIPFIVLSLVSSIITILAQKRAIVLMQRVPPPTRLLVAAKSLTSYLGKMMLPLNLVPYYPYPENMSSFSLEYIVPIVFVAGITLACLIVMQKRRLWMSVWSYYVITLVPVLGIVQVGEQSMADRYTYLPSLGPFLIIGLLSAKFYEKVTMLKRWKSILKIAGFFAALALLVYLSYSTIEQIGKWKNSIVFWNYVIDKEPSRVPVAHINLGNAYMSYGRIDMAIEQYQAALRLDTALRPDPDFAKAHYNLGNAYMSQGLIDMAIEQFQAALRLNPDSAKTHINLGNAYMSHGQIDMAIEQFQAASRLDPDFAEARYNLGNAYMSHGQIDMAIEQYQAALRLNPESAKARYNLGNAYMSHGLIDTAIEQYRAALKLDPDFTKAHYNLGTAYKSRGLIDMAIEQYQAALRIDPDFAEAHFNLGSIYLDNGSKDMARKEFELGLKNKPDDYKTRQVLNSIKSK